MTGSSEGRPVDDPERFSVRFTVLGVAVDIACPDRATSVRLAADWSRCGGRRPNFDVDPGPNNTLSLEVSGTERSLYAMASTVTMRVVQALVGQAVMLHAAGLSTQDGVVIGLVGGSGAGKSTATERLCRSAFGYVTDELLVVEPDGTVRAYPKPLSVIPEHGDRSGKVQKGPDQLALRSAAPTLRAGPFVVLDRRPGTGAPRLERLTLAEGLMRIIPQTSSLFAMPQPLHLMSRLASQRGVFRLDYSEIEDAVGLLTELATMEIEPDEWSPDPVDDDLSAALWDGRYRRGVVLDGIRIDGEMVVMIENTPQHVAGIGVTLWDAAKDALTHADLRRAVVAAHGDHPDADALVADAVEAMLRAGTLTQHRPLVLVDVMAGASGGGHDASGSLQESSPLDARS